MKVSTGVISLIYIITIKECQTLIHRQNAKFSNSSTVSDSSREGRIFFNNFFGFPNILGGGSSTVLDDVSDSSVDDEDDQEKTRNCTCECGISNHENRIVGGRPTGINHYPWIARIVYDGHFHCGASLVSENHVLTAAHCVRKLKRSKIRVILGDHDQSITTDVPAKMRAVSAIIRHRNFDTDTYNHDIALLKLRKPVELTKNIRPICLPPNSDPSGKVGVVIGWGRTSEGGMLPNVVQEVEVPILTLSECRAMKYRASRITSYMLCAGRGATDSCQGDSGGPLLVHNGDKYEVVDSDPSGKVGVVIGWGRTSEGGMLPNVVQEVEVPILTLSECRAMKYRASRITSYMLCAGRGATDSCQGDSGGPLLVHNGDKYEVVGIVSWGVGCGRPGYPGVYTRVSRYVNWLKLNLEDTCICS